MEAEKRGLVLEGGASRGAYQIGAYKALAEAGVHYDAVVGTSIGAINGAMIVQGDWEKAWHLWNNLTFEDVFQGDETMMEKLLLDPFDIESIPVRLKVGLEFARAKGMDIAPLRALLRTHIDEERLRKKDCLFGLTTINLTKRRVEQPFLTDMPQGTLHDYLLAGAYMLVFQRHKLMGDDYLDGCFYDNLPWNMLTAIGYTDLTLIRLPGTGRVISHFPNNVRIMQIEPSEPLPGMMGFHYSVTRHMLNLGYLDAKRALGETKGTRYYIEKSTLPEEDLPLLYELEEMAHVYGISRYRITSWDAFLNEIRENAHFINGNGWEAEKQAILARMSDLPARE